MNVAVSSLRSPGSSWYRPPNATSGAARESNPIVRANATGPARFARNWAASSSKEAA
jgi:hypothetical protein